MELSFTLNRLGLGTTPIISQLDTGEKLIPLQTEFQYKENFSIGFPKTSYPEYREKEVLNVKIYGIKILSDFKIDSRKTIYPLPLASMEISDTNLRNIYGTPQYLNLESFNIELPDRILKVFGWDYINNDFSQKADSELIRLEYSRLKGNRVAEGEDEIYKTLYLVRFKIALDPQNLLLGVIEDKPVMKAEFIEVNVFSENEYLEFKGILSNAEPTCYYIEKDRKEVYVDKTKRFIDAVASPLTFTDRWMKTRTESGESYRVFIIGEQDGNGKFIFNVNGNYIKILGEPYSQTKLFPRINQTFQNPNADIFKFWLSKFIMGKNYVLRKDNLSYSEAISIKIDPPAIRLLPNQNPLEQKLFTLQDEFIIKDIQFEFNNQEVLMDDVQISDLKVNIPTELTENLYFDAEYIGENLFPKIQLDKLGTFGLSKFRFSRVVYLLKEPTNFMENGVSKAKIEIIECFLAKMDTATMISNGGSGMYDNYWLQFEFPILKDGAKWYAHSPEIESQGLYPVISKTDTGMIKNILKIEYPLLTLKNLNDGSLEFISSPFDNNVFGGKYIEMGKVWENFQDFLKAMEFYAPQDFSTITIYSKADGRAITYRRTNIISIKSISPELVFKQVGGGIDYIDQLPTTEVTITGLKITLGQRNIQFPTFKIKPYYSFYSAMNGILKPDGSYMDIISVKIYNSESYLETKSVTVFYDLHLLEIPTYDPEIYDFIGAYKRLTVCADSTNMQEIMSGVARMLIIDSNENENYGVIVRPDLLTKVQFGIYPRIIKTTNGYDYISEDKNYIQLFTGNYIGNLNRISDLYLDLNASIDRFFSATPLIPPKDISYSQTSYSFVSGGIVNLTPLLGTEGETPISWTVTPSLPTGLTLNPTTGVISGTPTEVISSNQYEITAKGTNVLTKSFTLTIAILAQIKDISYPQTAYSLVTNTAFTATPTLGGDGDTPTNFAISPPLPTGLSINSTTGIISGTPTVAFTSTTFTITASKETVTKTAIFTLEVLTQLRDISYPQTAYSFFTGNAISLVPVLSTVGDTPVTWSITPALPSGITLNPSTGVISGTPTSAVTSTEYTISGSRNTLSKTTKITITITVSNPITSVIYNGGSVAMPIVNNAVSYTPVVTGGVPASFSITPALPSGLTLNPSTGVISGTPSIANDTTYTITATNSVGSRTASFRIRIVYVNTTITMGQSPNWGSGFYYGYNRSSQYASGRNGVNPLGNIGNNTFRSGQLLTMVIATVNGFFYEMNMVVNGSFVNSDGGFFRQIVWNGRTITRSSCSFNGMGGISGTNVLFSFPGVNPIAYNFGGTTTLIIE